MKLKFLLFLYLTSLVLFSQEFTKEIGLVSENDAYMMGGDDGYYTNGLKLYTNWKGRDSLKVYSLEAEQLMYNAQNGDYSKIEDIDRPVTAYLHLTFKQTQFTSRKDLIKWGISLGAIGSIALGKEAQIALHDMLSMYDPKEEWEYQLKNSVGINGEFTWVKEIPVKSNIEFQTVAAGRAGFFFTNIELGTLFRWGKFNPNTHTSYWNTRLNVIGKKSRHELFFYFQPSFFVYAYNATVQGGLFRKDKGPVTGSLNPLVYHHKIGVSGSWNRFALNLSVNYQTKETSSQRRTQWYGSIQLNYLIK